MNVIAFFPPSCVNPQFLGRGYKELVERYLALVFRICTLKSRQAHFLLMLS